MNKWFEIEHADGVGGFSRYLVHAKTYEEGAAKISQHFGDGTFRLLAVFEQLETDKKMLRRIA